MKKNVLCLSLLSFLLLSCSKGGSSIPSSSSSTNVISTPSVSLPSSPSDSKKSESQKPSVKPHTKSKELTMEMLDEISTGASLVIEVFHQTVFDQYDDDGKLCHFIAGCKNYIDVQFTLDEYAFQLYSDVEVPLNKDPELTSPTKDELVLSCNYFRDISDSSKLKMKVKDSEGKVKVEPAKRGEKVLGDDFYGSGLYDFFADLSTDMFVKTKKDYEFTLDLSKTEDGFLNRVSNALTGADPISPLKSLTLMTNGYHVSEFVAVMEDTELSAQGFYYLYHHTYHATVIALGDDEEVSNFFLR